MGRSPYSILTALLAASVYMVLGQVVTFSPSTGINYAINIPSDTASKGSGTVYFQIQAPSTFQWIGLGQGSRMEGANIFIMYAASDSNITLSPRSGLGSFEPNFNPSAKVSLLDGTGISNNVMTANVRCDSCISWSGGSMDVKSTSSSWIWAYKSGSAVDSSSVSADLTQHDDKGAVTVDLTKATGGSSSDPFVTQSNSGSSINNGNTSTSNGNGSTNGNSTGSTSGSSSSSSSTSSTYTTSGVTVADSGQSGFNRRRTAHGLIMAFVFLILFPGGALTRHLIRSPKTIPYIHAPFQLFTLAAAVAGLGLGVSLALDIGEIYAYHPVIGLTTVSALIAFQPLLGVLQHLNYRKNGTKSPSAYAHRWLGRILMVLGIINGGLGFMFSGIGTPGVPTAAVIAYGVIAGFMGIAYILTLLLSATRLKSPLNTSTPNGCLTENAAEHSLVPAERSISKDGK
ncbi:hypothetical protein Egran_03632 [Elaphomyces granulatus]|uniref:Cytochrome b561 domain-containing protein n=1 Tax=Elaphomyces granulatus TaxID=519963 RepID=A0A232LWR3_9EURO|nr:hypothetical protein Egran_03632 [Elaphomyces granulatus]